MTSEGIDHHLGDSSVGVRQLSMFDNVGVSRGTKNKSSP